MNRTLFRATPRGFTLIELLVVILVLALIATLAAPSFTRFMAKKRVEGITSELVTDLQYARSEAVQRNVKVRITFGTSCYVIHTWHFVGSASCNQSGSTVTGGFLRIKSVEVPGAANTSLSPNNSMTFIEFEPLSGSADPDGTIDDGWIDVSSASGEWRLRAVITPVGRVRTCSPNNSMSGFSSCT